MGYVGEVTLWWCVLVGRQKVSARQEVGWGSRAVRAGGVLFHKFKVRRDKKTSPPKRTFDIVSQECDFAHVLCQLRAYLFIRLLFQLRPRVHGIVVRREQGFNVPSFIRTVSDVGEELQLCCHTARGEDGQCFALSSFPLLECRHDVVEERGLQITVAEASCP